MSPKVFVTSTKKNLSESIRECFNRFGGINNIIKGEVFIKINAAMPDLTAITNIDIILETIKIVKEANPTPEKIYVFDSAALGFPTRLVYMMDNLAKRIKKLGAIPLYLDEQPSIDLDFQGEALDYPAPIPKILYEKLIEQKDKNTYINIPRLKIHLQTEVTACIKNQHGLIYDTEKIHNHHLMHEKILEIYKKFKPDFNIVDAIGITNHGNFAFREDWVIPMNLLLAGIDAVAVDTVGAKLIGVEMVEVKYLRLAGEQRLGVSDYSKIEVIPNPEIIEKNKKEFNYLVDNIPIEHADGIQFIEGNEMCCRTGCGYLKYYLKYITSGRKAKPLIGIAGKGHDTSVFDKYPGPFLVNGPCPSKELRPYFDERKKTDKKLKVHYVDEHFDIVQIMAGIVKGAGISLLSMSDMLKVPTGRLLWGYISAGIHRARYNSMM